MRTRTAIAAVCAAILVGLAVAACGGSSDTDESTPTTTEQLSDESASPATSKPAEAVEEPSQPTIDEPTGGTSTTDGTMADDPAEEETPTAPISVEDEAVEPPAQPTPEPDAPPLQEIVIENGEPVGGVARVEGKKGGTIAFAVRSDIPEEVHVHGFDVTKTIDPGSATKFKFKADFEGIFEVEAHHAGNAVIAKVVVSP